MGQSVIVRTCRFRPELITGLSLDSELSLPSPWCLSIPSAASSSPPLLFSPCSAAEWGFPAHFLQGKTHSDPVPVLSAPVGVFLPSSEGAHPKAWLTNTPTGAADAWHQLPANNPGLLPAPPGHCQPPNKPTFPWSLSETTAAPMPRAAKSISAPSREGSNHPQYLKLSPSGASHTSSSHWWTRERPRTQSRSL